MSRTRFHTGVFDRALLRDGFSTDEGEADRAILPTLNECITELIFTGQYKCKFSLALRSGVREYRLDPGIGTILRATYSGMPLKKTSMTTLDRWAPGWERPTGEHGIPRELYTDIPDVVGFYPLPNISDPSGTYGFEFIAEALTDDLTYPTDVPQRLPSMFHDFLPHGAAAKILVSLGDTESLAKAQEHKDKWAAAVKLVRDQANHSFEDESVQFSPANNYRDFYRQGTGWGPWW